jgi:isopenicillin N synthase-like dioxygenase
LAASERLEALYKLFVIALTTIVFFIIHQYDVGGLDWLIPVWFPVVYPFMAIFIQFSGQFISVLERLGGLLSSVWHRIRRPKEDWEY